MIEVELLEVNNLKIYYRTLRGYVKAVDDVSFYVKKGEVLGIAGESGCGKSTLGNSLILLSPPMEYIDGKVFLENEELPLWDSNKMRKYRYKRISIIPQYALNALNPTVKIGRYIDDLLHEHNEALEGEILKELKKRLKIVNLEESILNMYPIELSGGMKQRMVLVISTLMNPKVLIADEITSALDVSTQKAVIEMLMAFKEYGFVQSIIFITHDLHVLYQISNRIMIMYAGKVAEIADSDVIIHNPQHPYTKALLSSLPKPGIKYETKKLKGIKGQPPALLTPPIGCRFKDRCEFREEICDKEPTKLVLEKEHIVYCWHVQNIRGGNRVQN